MIEPHHIYGIIVFWFIGIIAVVCMATYIP